jgi:type I restriction enzyme S subunit
LGPHAQYPKSVKAGIPKFSDSRPGWSEVEIGDLFEVIIRPVEMIDETVYKLVTVKRSRGGVIERSRLQGKKISVKSQYYVEAGDFLISKRQIVHGACGFVPDELSGSIVSNEYSVLHCRGIILPEFLKYLIQTPYFQQTCFHSSIGVHVEKMIFKLEYWFKWKIFIPSIEEQLEIATFLNSVDEKIIMLRRKRELLETYKRGLMQKMFSQEVRFKQDDGSNFRDWDEVYMDEIFGRVTTKNIDANQNVLTISAQQGLVAQKKYFNKSVSSLNLTGYYFLEENDFAYNKSYSKGYPMGAIKRLKKIEVGVVSPLYICFRAKNEREIDFYEQYFNSGLQNRELYKIAQEGARNHGLLNVSVVAFFEDVIVPRPEEREQKKIADFLIAIDQKADAVEQQIMQLEKFMNGLLQEIFV